MWLRESYRNSTEKWQKVGEDGAKEFFTKKDSLMSDHSLSDALLIIAEPVTPPTKDGGKPHTSCRLGYQLLKAKKNCQNCKNCNCNCNCNIRGNEEEEGEREQKKRVRPVLSQFHILIPKFANSHTFKTF